MGIQRKITFAYFICFFVMMVVGYYFFSMMMFEDLNMLEKEISRHKLDGGYSFLSNEARRIQRTLQDYSSWSQTCEFIKKPNETYRNENLQWDVLNYLDITFIGILNEECEWVDGVYGDEREKGLVAFPEHVKHFMVSNRLRWANMKKQDMINGFCQISGVVYLVAISPVTREKREGPINGYMFMGVKLSMQKMNEFSAVLEENMSIVPQALCPGTAEYCFVRNAGQIAVCRPIIDIFKRPAQRLKMTINRDVFAFAVKANHQFLLWYVISSLVVFGVLVGVFEFVVMRPIRKANRQLTAAMAHDISINVKADDEQLVDLIHKTNLTAEVLKKTAETNRQFIEEAPMGIILLDEDMKIYDVNRKALHMSGYESYLDLRGKDSTLLFYQDRYAADGEANASRSEFSYYLKKNNGDIVPVSATRNPLRFGGREMTLVGLLDQSGQLEAKAAAEDYKRRFEDVFGEFQRVDQALKNEINQHRKTQAELIEVRQKLENYTQLRYALLSNLSHAMKTPLNGLIGFADLINDDTMPAEQLRANLKTISLCSSQLLEVVNEVMDISQLESGDVKPVYEIVRLKTLLSGVHDHWMKNVKPGVEFVLRLPAEHDELTMAMDREWFMKICAQLLNNAFKFTDSGKVELGYRLENGIPLFFVTDTGIGMSEEVKHMAMEMFYQAENILHRRFEGLGLGLSIVQQIVAMMNGRVRIESTPGGGTTVSFWFSPDNGGGKNDYYVV